MRPRLSFGRRWRMAPCCQRSTTTSVRRAARRARARARHAASPSRCALEEQHSPEGRDGRDRPHPLAMCASSAGWSSATPRSCSRENPRPASVRRPRRAGTSRVEDRDCFASRLSACRTCRPCGQVARSGSECRARPPHQRAWLARRRAALRVRQPRVARSAAGEPAPPAADFVAIGRPGRPRVHRDSEASFMISRGRYRRRRKGSGPPRDGASGGRAGRSSRR